MYSNYLSERTVVYGSATKSLERGCPQGSVVGPLLWNLGYNTVMEKIQARWTKCYCYADDTLTLVTGVSREEAIAKVKREIKKTQEDMAPAGLSLNLSKVQVMLVTRRRSEKEALFVLYIDNTRIVSCTSFKYLGVILDDELSWLPHIKALYRKVIEMMPKLCAVARNTYGYSSEARRIMLEGTIGAWLVYASSCWAHRLNIAYICEWVDRMHRLMVICYGRLYRTVSYLPATVITGWMPVKYTIAARVVLWTRQRRLRTLGATILGKPPEKVDLNEWLHKTAMKAWNDAWKACPKGKWTQELMPEARAYKSPTCFMMSMALSGHGTFAAYRHRIGKAVSAACKCGAEIQDARHVFKMCPLYTLGRPVDWDLSNALVRKYLMETANQIWEEEIAEARRRTIESNEGRGRAGDGARS